LEDKDLEKIKNLIDEAKEYKKKTE
jgi:hypothetical protein